jgi:PAS domain S-box-containing protein
MVRRNTDIEERKRTEEALRSSEGDLAAIVNTIPTAAWTTRPDGHCDFLNRVWLDYAGMTMEEAQGWRWAEAIHPDDRTKLVEEWQSCLASGTPVDTEARIRRFDGSYRWFLIRGNPLKDERGKILKWYGTCVDIEDRKRGEETLRARELSWRQVVDNIPGLVATTSALGEIEFLNRQNLEYFGKTTRELKDWALVGVVHPDDLPRVIEARKKSIEVGQIYEVEHRCRRADGVYRWFQVRGLPVRNTQDKITAWYLLLTDIDDRKRAEEALRQSEQRWRTAFENSAISIMMRNLEGRFIAANSSFQNMLGYTESELCQLNFMDVTHEEHRKAELQLIGEILEGKRQHYQIEKRYRRKDGALLWVRNNVALVPGMRDAAPFVFAVVEDITQRKQEESARRDSEERHRVVVETANDAVVSADENGAIQFANPATTRIFGYDPAELIGKPLTILMPEFMRKLHQNGFRRYLATGQRHINWQGTELTGLRKNGQEFPLEVSFGEIVTDSGRIFTGFIRDVSARKRAEENLRRSEQRWRAVFENSAIGVALTDMTGRFLATNSAYQQMLGYPEDELKKLTFLELTLDDDAKRNRALVAELIDGKRSQFQIEKRYLRKDGRPIWVSNNVSLVPGTEDVPQFVMALSEDITGRKQAEDTFRLILEGTAPTTGSDFFQSLVQHMAQALRAHYAFVTACDDQKHARTLAFWKGDGFGENFEFDIADTPCEKVLRGEICHYREGLQGLFPLDKLVADWQAESYLAVPMLDRSNRVIGHMAILDDKPMETDLRSIDLLKIFASRAAAELKRQKAEDELKAALQERERMREELAHLAHLNRVSIMGELTASLAHEISQPIGAAVTNAQACLRFLNREQPDLPEACGAALEMVRDATRAVDIIDRVRSMYQKGSPHLEMVDINEVILEMVVMLRNEANRNSVKMHTDLDETLPQVMADRVQLQQGLMNLMMNGVEAMRDSGGDLGIKSQLDEKGQLRISVSDTGVGLPTGKETEIFNAFFTTKSEGTGLGLAITRTIVESHGGRVWATNNTLRGTTFQFTLPSTRVAHA